MWTCAIEGCGHETERVEDLLVHQVTGHDHHACAVCGAVSPDGYFAIRHAFDEHSRAEYARAYAADTAEVRHREAVLAAIERHVDLEEVDSRIDRVEDPPA
jgi:hypothetical protein